MKVLYKFLMIFCIFFAVSCSSELTLSVQKDGGVKIVFSGNLGEEISKFFLAQSGVEKNGENADSASFDENFLLDSLKSSGFSNVKVNSAFFKNFSVSMEDFSKKSLFFTSELFVFENDSVKTNFSVQNLKKMYEFCDEEMQMNLDLLLAPVFNDEQMSEDEYLETLATFYGENISTEMKNCILKINLIDKNGKTENVKVSVPRLLCGY